MFYDPNGPKIECRPSGVPLSIFDAHPALNGIGQDWALPLVADHDGVWHLRHTCPTIVAQQLQAPDDHTRHQLRNGTHCSTCWSDHPGAHGYVRLAHVAHRQLHAVTHGDVHGAAMARAQLLHHQKTHATNTTIQTGTSTPGRAIGISILDALLGFADRIRFTDDQHAAAQNALGDTSGPMRLCVAADLRVQGAADLTSRIDYQAFAAFGGRWEIRFGAGLDAVGTLPAAIANKVHTLRTVTRSGTAQFTSVPLREQLNDEDIDFAWKLHNSELMAADNPAAVALELIEMI